MSIPTRHRRILLLSALTAALLLAFRLTAPQGHPAWDRAILDWFGQIRSNELDHVFTLLTWLGSLLVLGPLAAFIVWRLARLQRLQHAWLLLLSLGGVAIIGRLAKAWIARPRPDFHSWLITLPIDSAYPSLHALQATAFFLALALIVGNRGFWPLAIGMAIIIALSRLYLQVHFPSDIAAGMLGATIWTLAVYWTQEKRHEK